MADDWKWVLDNETHCPQPSTPPAGLETGWLVVQMGPQGLLSYPVLYLPRPSIEEICTAYQKHPNRGKK